MKKSVQSCAESEFKGNKQQIVVARNIGGRNWSSPRLQNSPYFYVFKYARTVKKKGLDRGWKQRARLHVRRVCETRALLAREILGLFLRYVKPILRKKSTALQSSHRITGHIRVTSSLCFNARLSSKPLISIIHANKTHFHQRGFALKLVLKVRFSESGNGIVSVNTCDLGLQPVALPV